MRAVRLAALAAAIALGSPVPSRAALAPPETTEVFVATEALPVQAIPLARRFILTGSERVTIGDRVLAREVDYRLDTGAGTLRLVAPLAPGDSLSVSYAFAPLALPTEVIGLVPGEPTPPESAHVAIASPATSPFPRQLEPELTIGGAKTLALEVGSNKDAAVEQSLRVSLGGTVGDDVKITALLSDQNVPLQPEGNTQRLEELDEVLVKVEAPRAGATLGDFLSGRHGTPFADYERRLTGAEAVARIDSSSVRGVGAKARGNFQSVEFRGVEGKQGPYVLAGSGFDVGGVIVAGSERVWMDGQLLTRGDVNDYVMDYSLGVLEFTNRRLVTRDSEIAVDFEVAEQAYKRSFYTGEGRSSLASGRYGFRASVTAENDGDEPTNFTLTQERRAALEAAGDSTALVPGAVCGVEGGDYDDVGGIFEYAGRDSGSCEVAFTFVGAAQGDYVRDRDLDTGFAFFRFAGAGLGDHVPGLLLTAPHTTQLADVGFTGRAGQLVVDADGAFSRQDLNRLSNDDDANNDGAAGRVALGWLRDAPGPEALHSGVTANVRGQESEFSPLGRTREVFLGERWDFTDSTRADETLAEVDGWIERPNQWRVGVGSGVLDRTGLFRSVREEARAHWTGPRNTIAGGRLELVQRTDDADSAGTVHGDLLRGSANYETQLRWFRPGATYWREDRVNERAQTMISGQDDQEFGASLGVEAGRGISGRVRGLHRTTDVVNGGYWMRQSVARTIDTALEAAPRPDVRMRVSWIRRELDFTPESAQQDQTTTLTRSDLAHESFGGTLRGEYTYETTSRAFIDRVQGVTGTEEPVLALAASARIRLGGRRMSGTEAPASAWSRFLSVVETETFARVDEESVAEDRGAIYRLDFSQFQDDSTTVFGKTLVRQEVTLFPGSPTFTITGRWERIDTEDNRTDPERLEILSERTVLRARNALAGPWTLESQGTLEDESRSDSRLGLAEFDLRRTEIREELVFQPTPARRFSGRVVLGSERNQTIDASIRGFSLGASGSSALGSRGRVQGDVSWTHPTSIEGIDFSNRFRTPDNDQLEWRGLFDVRLSESISGSLSVTGRSVDGLPTTHLVRAEARALF